MGRAGGPPLLDSYEEAGSGRLYRFRQRRFSIAGREVIDTLEAVRRYDFAARVLPSYRLKEVAKHFGLAASDRVYLEGSKVYETYCKHPDLVRHYALDDVREVDGLSRRLMGAAFALAGMAPRSYGRVASAGPAMGILEPLLVRAYLRAGFREIGRRRQSQRIGDRAYDVVLMDCLATEFGESVLRRHLPEQPGDGADRGGRDGPA